MQHFVLQVTTGSETKAKDDLQGLGLAVTCPMTIKPWRNPRKRNEVKPVSVPVLPGYVIISGEAIQWRDVRAIQHVVRPIDCGGEPQAVSAELVQYVADLEGVKAQDMPFKLKQRVQILDDYGNPSGMIGTIAKLFGVKKAELNLDAFGHATVDLAKLEAA